MLGELQISVVDLIQGGDQSKRLSEVPLVHLADLRLHLSTHNRNCRLPASPIPQHLSVCATKIQIPNEYVALKYKNITVMNTKPFAIAVSSQDSEVGFLHGQLQDECPLHHLGWKGLMWAEKEADKGPPLELQVAEE